MMVSTMLASNMVPKMVIVVNIFLMKRFVSTKYFPILLVLTFFFIMASKLTNDEFIKRIDSISDCKISILGKYDGINRKILCRCNVCGNEWVERQT